ncbi:MAG: type II secretion system protein GspL [Myxococcaceae bacterium]
MARVLGLDLGSHSLKAVLMETTYRGATIKGTLSVPVPADGERLDRLKAALPKLIEQGAAVTVPGQQPLLAADQVVVALPGTTLATHPIALPFNDPKKIESTLAFEVEGQLPYDLADAIYDHQTAIADDKGAQLLVGVARKAELQAVLDVLKEAKLDPRVVTHAGLVYQNVFATLPPTLVEGDASVAILDLGHERCSLAIGKPGGSIEFARTFAGGGWSLTKALSNEFKIGLNDAQAWKEEHGAVGSEVVGGEAERAAGAFMRALQPVLRDLRSTLKSSGARSRKPVGLVLLCGGTSKLKGLPEQLARDLNVPCKLLELPADTREVLGVNRQDLAQAWALALRGTATGAKAPRFNLRRGEFAFKSDFDFASDKMGQLGAFALVLFVLLIASGIVRNSVLERREKQVDAVLCDVTTRILGKCEKDFSIALSMLRGQESPAAGIPARSATTLLAELTSHVPPEMHVTFDQVVIDLERISLRCETESSKSLEELIAALKTYKCFKEINEGRVEKSKDGTKVSSRLEIQVECPAEGGNQG